METPGVDGDTGKVIGAPAAAGSRVDKGAVVRPQPDTRAASIIRKVTATDIFFIISPKT
jgi:hypothetical protein